MKRIIKFLLFILIAGIIGFIPAWFCVYAGSWVLLIFLGIIVSEAWGNVILVLLTFGIGSTIVAEMIGLKK